MKGHLIFKLLTFLMVAGLAFLVTVLTILVASALVFFAIKSEEQPEAEDSSDLMDTLVDAGIGFSASPTETELLEHRKLVIASDINAACAQRIIAGLLLLDARDHAAPIDLYLRTEGGWPSDAFAIIAVMGSIQAPVNTHALGGTHSSGAMILTAGTGVRYGYPHSLIMFHGGWDEPDDKDGEHSRRTAFNRQFVQFWKQHARLPADWVDDQEEELYFMTPEEALKFGLIDQIRDEAVSPEAGPGK
jgi:ATP-dependent Clp protease protease subunit